MYVHPLSCRKLAPAGSDEIVGFTHAAEEYSTARSTPKITHTIINADVISDEYHRVRNFAMIISEERVCFRVKKKEEEREEEEEEEDEEDALCQSRAVRNRHKNNNINNT